jgi:S-adenosyl methyltransferase
MATHDLTSGDEQMLTSGDEQIPLDVPTSARAYSWMLGGKENFAVDREFILATLEGFPECVDIARQNRQFLYRVVRYLVQDAGIDQFIDLGCGLPTNDNVHQVAQMFNPATRVVYVDIDPIVLAHGRALLANDASTTVITADMRNPSEILNDPETRRLIDFRRPVAMMYLSVGHHLKDADSTGRGARHAVRHIIDAVAASGSHLALSQVVIDDPVKGARMSEAIDGAGIPWQTRTPGEVDALVDGLQLVEPGLVNVRHWRPDEDQPPLEEVPPELRPYIGITDTHTDVYEYGGVARKA